MKFLMVTDAARVLGKSAEMVRHYERTGKLAAIKTLNGRRLFREDDVQNFAQRLAVKAEETRELKNPRELHRDDDGPEPKRAA